MSEDQPESERSPPKIVQAGLTQDELDRLPSNFLNTTSLIGSRATFIAGFSYYSIGRYQFSCCVNDTYVTFNTVAFVGAVVVAALACMFAYYLQRHKTQSSKVQFCLGAIAYQRSCYRIGSYSTTMYMIGIGLLGFAYYPATNFRYVPLVAMCCGAAYVTYGEWYIIFSQLRFQSNFGSINDGYHVDHKKIERDNQHLVRTGETFQNFVLKQAATISGRAVFIAGVGQQAIMRYMPYPAVYSYSQKAANSFIVFAAMSCAAALSCGSVLSILQTFIPDTVKEKQFAFTVYIKPIIRYSILGYVFSILCLFMSNFTVAEGCDYASLGNITMSFGIIACVILFSGLFSIRASLQWIAAKNSKSSTVPKEEKPDPEVERRFNNEMSAINTGGSMSTFAAGYLYYNVATFDTDVLRLPWNNSDDLLVKLFLAANILGITVALLAAVQDTLITVAVNQLQTLGDRVDFLKANWLLCHSCTWFYHLSLLFWFAVFALFGFIKYNRWSYIPFAYGVAGIIVMYAGTGYLHMARKASINFGANGCPLKCAKMEKADDGVIDVCISRPTLLASLAFTVIFLGGFAYFAINFFQFNGRKYETLYLHSMSICFMTSMWVMVFSDRYTYQMSKCPTKVTKLEFANTTFQFYKTCVVLSYCVVASLLIGFAVMGYIKTGVNYKQIQNIIAAGSFEIACVSLLLVVWIVWEFLSISNETRVTSFYDKEAKQSMVARFKSQMLAGTSAAGFICGNVCYETLFSDAGSDVKFFNYYYFFMVVSTFACGITAILASTTACLCLGELRSLDAKMLFAHRMKRLKLVIFFLSMTGLLTWLASVIALGEVKYMDNKSFFYPSLISGSVGLAYVLYSLYDIRRLSEDTLKLEEGEPVELLPKNDFCVVTFIFSLNPLNLLKMKSLTTGAGATEGVNPMQKSTKDVELPEVL